MYNNFVIIQSSVELDLFCSIVLFSKLYLINKN